MENMETTDKDKPENPAAGKESRRERRERMRARIHAILEKRKAERLEKKMADKEEMEADDE